MEHRSFYDFTHSFRVQEYRAQSLIPHLSSDLTDDFGSLNEGLTRRLIVT